MIDRQDEMQRDTRVLEEALGLRPFGRGGTSLRGELGGAPIRVELSTDLAWKDHPHRDHRHRDPDQDERLTEVMLPFDLALDAGLRVALLPEVGEVVDGFESSFRLVAEELDRGQALVPEAAREALLASVAGRPGPRVADDGIRWGRKERPPFREAARLVAPIRALATVWRAVKEAARSVRPTSGTEAAVDAMDRVRGPGLERSGAPSGMVGYVGQVRLSVWVERQAGGGWPTRVVVRPPAAVPGFPKVVREQELGWVGRAVEAVAGRSELTLGDPAFDRRFAVRSGRPDVLREVLGPEVRRGMLALDRLLQVELGAGGLTATGRLRAPDDVAEVARIAQELASSVGAWSGFGAAAGGTTPGG